MAYRCDSCGKMASVDVEASSVDVNDDGDGDFSITAELELTSQCCGQTVATASAEDSFSGDVEHSDDCDEDSRTYSCSVDSEDPTDWYDGKPDKNGKMPPIRYQRHFWGVEGTVTVTCDVCSAETTVDYRVGEAGSSFEAY